jgi:hypothetical protein
VTARQASRSDPRSELAAEINGVPNARIATECGGPCAERVLLLRETILDLVAQRQELRSRTAGHDELEANRLALVRSQRQLSYALIGQHRDLAHDRAAA